ncbi:MAG: hypothetical protein KAS52_07390 [Candidatus Heimdallarchaeota archaeon]|nr:hypothetical protein [Candidatus Heimdallarchaeota archaeon]
MFDNLELPSSMVDYLISITPILGISGTLESYTMYVFSKYFALYDNKILLHFAESDIPETISLNILRKGEDNTIISGTKNEKLDPKRLETSKALKNPYYIHSVITFEAKLEKKLDYNGNETLAIYEVVAAFGVAGLDPTFNDKVTLAKTIEIMSLSSVDNYIIERKIENC